MRDRTRRCGAISTQASYTAAAAAMRELGAWLEAAARVGDGGLSRWVRVYPYHGRADAEGLGQACRRRLAELEAVGRADLDAQSSQALRGCVRPVRARREYRFRGVRRQGGRQTSRTGGLCRGRRERSSQASSSSCSTSRWRRFQARWRSARGRGAALQPRELRVHRHSGSVR